MFSISIAMTMIIIDDDVDVGVHVSVHSVSAVHSCGHARRVESGHHRVCWFAEGLFVDQVRR